jgi:hypothetical protein
MLHISSKKQKIKMWSCHLIQLQNLPMRLLQDHFLNHTHFTAPINQFRSKNSGPHSSLQVALHSDPLFLPVTP